MNIIGMTNDMVFWPYPNKVIAPDGAAFQAVILYNTADKNIGILHTLPNGEQKVFSNELYAAVDSAEGHAAEMCAAYMRANKLKNANFPLYIKDIRIAMTAPMLDLEQKAEKAPGEKVISCSSTILESVKDSTKSSSVRIGRFVKDSEMDDWCYGVALESTIHGEPYKDEFVTMNLSTDELYELLTKIQENVIEAAKDAA